MHFSFTIVLIQPEVCFQECTIRQASKIALWDALINMDFPSWQKHSKHTVDDAQQSGVK